MNFKWMWQISLLHLYCSYPPLSSHLTASHFPHLFHIFPAVYLQFLFYTSVQTLHFHISFTSIFYPFLSPLNSCPLPLFIYWFCLLFFSSSCQFFGPLLPFALASRLLVSFDFFFLISFVLFSPQSTQILSLLSFIVLSPYPFPLLQMDRAGEIKWRRNLHLQARASVFTPKVCVYLFISGSLSPGKQCTVSNWIYCCTTSQH